MRNSWGQQPREPPPHVCGLHLQNSTRCPQWRADKGHLLLWQWTRESNHHEVQSILHLKGLLSRKTLSEWQSTGGKGSSPKAPLAFLSQPKDYCCSVTKSCPVLCNPMNCSMPGFSVLLYHPTFAQTHIQWVGDAIQPSHSLLPLLLLLSIFPSIRTFSSELAVCIRWPKNWSLSLSISPSNEYSGLISFRIDWLDLLAIQGTLKSPLQNHSLKASTLQCSALFIVQLSHDYWKNHSFDYMGKLRNTLKVTVKQHRPTKRLRFTLCYVTGTNIVL